MIPVEEANFEIGFKLDLYQAGILLQKDIAKTVSVTKLKMRRGYSYEFKAELNASNSSDKPLEAIEFKVTGVEGWKEYTEVNANN